MIYSSFVLELIKCIVDYIKLFSRLTYSLLVLGLHIFCTQYKPKDYIHLIGIHWHRIELQPCVIWVTVYRSCVEILQTYRSDASYVRVILVYSTNEINFCIFFLWFNFWFNSNVVVSGSLSGFRESLMALTEQAMHVAWLCMRIR